MSKTPHEVSKVIAANSIGTGAYFTDSRVRVKAENTRDGKLSRQRIPKWEYYQGRETEREPKGRETEETGKVYVYQAEKDRERVHFCISRL